jgi:outer membrane receptor protein involved in Fe transport
MINTNQEGLESELIYEGQNQRFSTFATFSKSKAEGGRSQTRRPDLQYGANFSKKFINSVIGPFNMNLNYKFTGKHLDIDGGTRVAKSTQIVDLVLFKDLFGTVWNLNISNLLDEKYERPLTYSKNGRQLRIGFRKPY